MKRIVLSTSSSGLGYLKAPHQVQMIPMHLTVNDVAFVDGKDINPDMLSKIMSQVPSTLCKSAPATKEEVIKQFENLYEHGYQQVLVCSISSQFSDSFAIINEAKQAFEDKMDIHIYDTRILNTAEAVLAYEADYLMRAGAPIHEVIERLDEIRQHSLLLFTLSDLSHMIRNKKLSSTAGFMANLFDIKPIMQVNQKGQALVCDKVRQLDRTLYKMVQMVVQQAGEEAFIYMTDKTSDEVANLLKQILAEEFNITNVPRLPVSTISLANHGTLGVGIGAFYGKLPKLLAHLT